MGNTLKALTIAAAATNAFQNRELLGDQENIQAALQWVNNELTLHCGSSRHQHDVQYKQGEQLMTSRLNLIVDNWDKLVQCKKSGSTGGIVGDFVDHNKDVPMERVQIGFGFR